MKSNTQATRPKNQFGRLLKIERIKKDICLTDLAKELGITSAFLSSIEIGKTKVNPEMLDRIIAYLNLSEEKEKEFKEAAENFIKVKFNLKDAPHS